MVALGDSSANVALGRAYRPRAWLWAGLAVLKSFVPKYRASHLVEANNEFILYKNVMPTFSDLAQTEKPIIFNNKVLESVIGDPSLQGAPGA